MESGPRVPNPQRVVVASYASYAEAQRAVKYLSDEGFSVERVAIVAEDLQLVEQVTGRMGYGRAALQGAGFGAMSGVILGFFSGFLFSSFNPLASAPYLAILWLIYGAIIGFIVGPHGPCPFRGTAGLFLRRGDTSGPLQRRGRRGGSRRRLAAPGLATTCVRRRAKRDPA